MSDFLCLYVCLSYVSHYNDSKVPSQSAAGVLKLGRYNYLVLKVYCPLILKKHSSRAGSFDELNLYLTTMFAEICKSDDEP